MSHLRQTEGRTKKGKSIFLNTTKNYFVTIRWQCFLYFSFWIYILLSRLFCMYLLSFTTSSSSLLQHKLSLTLFSQPLPNSQIDLYKHQMQWVLKPTHTPKHSHKCVQHLSPSPKPAFAYKQDFWLSVSPVLLLFIWV